MFYTLMLRHLIYGATHINLTFRVVYCVLGVIMLYSNIIAIIRFTPEEAVYYHLL